MTQPPIAGNPFAIVEVGRVPFQVASVDAAAEWIIGHAAPGRYPINVRLANAYNVALADRDPNYGAVLANAGVNFPDGKPVVWFMNWLSRGRADAKQVRGPSLFARAMELGEIAGTRHFLLGSTPTTLQALESELLRRHPQLNLVGSYAPPFSPIDDAFVRECARQVEPTRPDVIWLGLGTPKQDLLGTQLSQETGTPTVSVGAAFDFLAGTVREAPRWVQGSGLEWLFRLAMEPRRLWKRYLLGNARFILSATRTRRLQVKSQSAGLNSAP